VWGIGAASRAFLYVDDAARGIVRAAEPDDGGDPVNLGAGHEVTICDLVALVERLTGYRGEVRCNPTKLDGQPRRALDTRRARGPFGFVARTLLKDGARRTVAWHEECGGAASPVRP
jgi:GDP-L-fucose synthase